MAIEQLEKIDLLRLISASRNLQIAQFRMLRDAAALAVEQVQDTRLRLLENPAPERTVEAVLLEIFIGFVLGPMVQSAVQSLVKGILNAVLRTRVAFEFLPRSDKGFDLAYKMTSIKSKGESERYLKAVLDTASREDITALYRDDAYAFLENACGTAFTIAPKLAEIHSVQAQPEDTPGVRVLASVTQSAEVQLFAIEYAHDLQSIWVQNDYLTEDQFYDLDALLRMNVSHMPSQNDLFIYRDHLRNHFEKLIWVFLYWAEITNTLEFHLDAITVDGLSKDLTEYLAKRLIYKDGFTFYEYRKKMSRVAESQQAPDDIMRALLPDLRDDLRRTKRELMTPSDTAKALTGGLPTLPAISA